MNQMDLAQKFSTLLVDDKLANFYLFNAALEFSPESIETWARQLMAQLYSALTNEGPERSAHHVEIGHPDFLFIRPSNAKAYREDDLKDFFSFFYHRPLRLDRKFVVLLESQKLTEALCNKLLKSLEDSPPWAHIFFFRPQNSMMLSTITGRAIEVKLSLDVSMESSVGANIPHFDPNKMGPNDIKDFLKTDKGRLGFVRFLLDQALGDKSYANKDKALEVIQSWCESEKYHTMPTSPLLGWPIEEISTTAIDQ